MRQTTTSGKEMQDWMGPWDAGCRGKAQQTFVQYQNELAQQSTSIRSRDVMIQWNRAKVRRRDASHVLKKSWQITCEQSLACLPRHAESIDSQLSWDEFSQHSIENIKQSRTLTSSFCPAPPNNAVWATTQASILNLDSTRLQIENGFLKEACV